MKQYYISVKYENKFTGKNERRYLCGKPQRILLVNHRELAAKYSEEDKNYFLNIFEPNETNVRLEEVE
ncbi:hypothetical protein DY125_07855 [Apilactobacillus micheneri]|uniref:hypothetical protein n=1 Tax=Apilactobacillus micheneri TaxID=1899430 RepID=UPI00112C718C|nr:hypothetical protein [Apilactobacillus micheneri]TPR46997.1 hypothetical protein DY125_07855 [Apilactobacillus micheneri]